MKPSDSLTKLHQLAVALELEGQNMSAFEAINGIMEALDCLSVSHAIQIIRDNQVMREGLASAADNIGEITVNLKAFENLVRLAHE